MNGSISKEMVILVILSLITIYNLINYFGTRELVKWLYERYRKEAAELANSDSLPADVKTKAHLENERAILEVLSKRRSHKFDLSLLISNIEFVLIAGSTFIVIHNAGSIFCYGSLSKIGLVILSWFGIKVLGYHGHWQQPIFGRSIFSVFLLG